MADAKSMKSSPGEAPSIEAPSGRTYRHDGPYLASKVPPRDTQLAAPVSGEVTIHWDRWGIAHIRAASPADLSFGLGYATAQECLWRLEYSRRLARGELAARIGRGVLASDIMMRRLGLGRHADALAGALPEALAIALTALAGGINRWIEQATAERRLPLEFDWLGYEPAPWTVGDSIALWKHRWWTLTGRLENIAVGEAGRRHLPPSLLSAFMAAELGEETIVPQSAQTRDARPSASQGTGSAPAGTAPGIPGGADSGEGSNNWAVSGTRTTTGFPVLCSDPHNPFGQPGQWFQAQLTLADASFDVAGAVLAGSPGVYFGRNRHLAWGFTNHVASARDLYVETVDPGRPGQYLEGGEWRPFEIEHAVIAVADAPDTTDVSIEIRRTVRGPLVGDLLPALSPSEPPISLRWTGLEVGSGLDALLGLNAAGNVGQALDALGGWVCPVANAVLADDQGRIAYHAIGRVPRRTEAVRAYRSASDPGHAWQGFIPYDDLPQHVDPPEGWVATANQPPWALDPPGLPYLGSAAWADGGRMRRIRQRLTAAPRLAPAAIADVQADVLGARAAELSPALVAALGTSADPMVQRAVALLRGWDGSYDLSSLAPTVWTAFWEAWLRRVASARFPDHLVSLVAGQCGAIARNLIIRRDTTPPWLAGQDLAAELERATGTAMSWLQERLGPDRVHVPPEAHSWRWEKVHTVTWRHPLSEHGPQAQRSAAGLVLDVGSFPTTGGAGTVRAAGHSATRPFHVVGGSTYRMVADLSPAGGLRATTTTGQSGHPGSPHYADQVPLWLGNTYHPFPMDPIDAGDVEGVTRIVPAPRTR